MNNGCELRAVLIAKAPVLTLHTEWRAGASHGSLDHDLVTSYLPNFYLVGEGWDADFERTGFLALTQKLFSNKGGE